MRPITNNIPKCLVEINKKPLLHLWLEKLENLNCDSVLINTHYLPLKVNKSIQEWDGVNCRIYTIFEKILLGTAGTLINNLDFFENSRGLIIHADNVTDDNLKSFLDQHPKDLKYNIINAPLLGPTIPNLAVLLKLIKIMLFRIFMKKLEILLEFS